jgi:hypothetical protein
MKRYIFPLILLLAIAAGFFAEAAISCWDILSVGLAASSPAVAQQQKADYETALRSVALDKALELDWNAPSVAWPASSSQFFAEPSGYVVKYRYDTPDGFPIFSNVASWNVDKLKGVYKELLKNKHGNEIKMLDAIYICSKSIRFQDDAVGEFIYASNKISISFRLPGLMANAAAYSVKKNSNTIRIADPGGNSTALDIANTLSHEYGHFYNRIYNPDGGVLDRKFTAAEKKKLNSNYIWLREEIEANDYITLMGSPDSFQKSALRDVKQELAWRIANGHTKDNYAKAQKTSQIFDTLAPLAYTLLSPASQVDGLASAYYQFLPNPPATPEIPTELPKLSIKSNGKNYTVSWTQPWKDKNTFYVLLCSSNEVDTTLKGLFKGCKWNKFICTRWGNEDGTATIGYVTQHKGNMIYSLDDEIAKGTKTFRVYAVLADNRIVVSEPLTYTFK